MQILFVSNQERSRIFYEHILSSKPVLDVPGMTEFKLAENVSLGIMTEKGILEILDNGIPDPNSASGIPRNELYLIVEDPVRKLDFLSKIGGKIISEVKLRSWGDMVGYGLDPDGHLIAFASSIQR